MVAHQNMQHTLQKAIYQKQEEKCHHQLKQIKAHTGGGGSQSDEPEPAILNHYSRAQCSAHPGMLVSKTTRF